MSARRAVRAASADPVALKAARARVDAAKHGLGERGPVWWDDDAPDWNRHLAKNTPYAEWFSGAGVIFANDPIADIDCSVISMMHSNQVSGG